MNSAQNVQAVNDIKQTTQSLNTAMTGFKTLALLIITKSYKVIIMSTQILIRKMITTMHTTMRMTLLMVMHNIQL